MSKTWLVVGLLVIFLLLVIINWPDGRAYLVACDVGQGDALLFYQGSTQILIDGGPDHKVIDCLQTYMPFWDRQLELLINTHPEQDHLAGLLPVVRQYRIGQLVANSQWQPTNLFTAFVQEVDRQNIPVYSPQQADQLVVANFNLKILWPQNMVGDLAIWQNQQLQAQLMGQSQVLGAGNQEPNTSSIVIEVSYKAYRILLTADITQEIEAQLLTAGQLEDIDILKVAHHGSKFSTTDQFLSTVRPETAIISVGQNQWGHPTGEVLDRLKSAGSRILRTDQTKIKIALD
jgi:competence protein ComEC